jgi:hypothetical protein
MGVAFVPVRFDFISATSPEAIEETHFLTLKQQVFQYRKG